MDPDFYSAHISPAIAPLAPFYDQWGQGLRPGDSSLHTVPTDSGFVCGLGRPRKVLKALVVHAQACHVQIASLAGSEWRVAYRGPKG